MHARQQTLQSVTAVTFDVDSLVQTCRRSRTIA